MIGALSREPVLERFEFDLDMIGRVKEELTVAAVRDNYQCKGYLAGGLSESEGGELTASEAFALRYPSIQTGAGTELDFKGVELTLAKQPGRRNYHIDTEGSADLVGCKLITDTLAVRAIANLSDSHPKLFRYINLSIGSLRFINVRGLYVLDGDPPEGSEAVLEIPPRQDSCITAAVFISSHLAHRGAERTYGHFLASYGAKLGVSFS